MFYYYKINVLERCNDIFTCSLCCNPRNSEKCKQFSTMTASLFSEHQRSCHPSVTELECIYCCCLVPSSKLIQHIQNHFALDTETRITCPICQEPLKQHWRSTIAHMHSQHSDDVTVCPHCCKHFPTVDALQTHLLAAQFTVFHCPFTHCLVKTHNKAAILSHLSKKHNGTRCIRADRHYTCAERLIYNTNCECASIPCQLIDSPMKLNTVTSDELQLVDLPYSVRVLAKLSLGLDERLQEDLCLKMEQYSKFKVRLEVVDGQKQFVCSTCQYRSVHSLADVRKHILGCHCSVSTSYTRLCLRASRLDTNNFTLFSDRKLISFANEKLKRAENGTGWEGNFDFSGLQLLDDSEQESGSNSESQVRSNKRQSVASGQETMVKRARIKQRQSHVTKMRPDSPVPEVGPPLERSENFDRVIYLNYSWPVLERLVLGQCPERYLPILKQKMHVYSQHRILLTRRNGKRYFLCSHCPNCSPHGMNDIRKHILGVHARLPERFKSAAMYCSRMNRDNYGLLSDDELLKKNQDMVKWRANPASLDQEDFAMEPLAPLHGSSSPEEDNNGLITNNNNNNNNNNNADITSPHNVFLSGECSPHCQTTITDQVSSFQSFFATMLANNNNNNNNGNHHNNNNNNDLSNESSPVTLDTTNHNPSKGRSRRSLVLKSKTTNHNTQCSNNQ